MAAYLIVQTNINDREAYTRLLDGIIPLLNRFKARIIAADNDAKVLEGTLTFGRTVIVEFESEKSLVAWNEEVVESGLAEMARNASNDYLVSYVEGVAPI